MWRELCWFESSPGHHFKKPISILKIILPILLFLSFSAYAKFDNYIYAVGAGPTNLVNETEIRTENGTPVLLFVPNIPSFFSFAVETKYIDLAYGFTTEAADPKLERSRFQDLKATGGLGPVDFRVNFQRYKGAMVDEAGLKEFYKNYEVNSINARGNYYFNREHLKYIRDGHRLIKKVSDNEDFSTQGSWFLGLNLDSRSIKLPDQLASLHDARVRSKDLDYDTRLVGFLVGPLGGGDGTLYYKSAYLRGKIGVGPAFVAQGETLLQFEFALNFGFVIGKRHLISLSADTYSVNFRPKNSEIQSRSSQGGFFYTYAFR